MALAAKIAWFVSTVAALLVGCAKQQAGCPDATPASAPPLAAPSVGSVPTDGYCGAAQGLDELRKQAEFEVAQLDAQRADWSVYAHQPNVYVRALSLLKLREQAQTASEAQLRRVVDLVSDGTSIYSAECAAVLTTCQRGQGIDFARGNCHRHAKTIGSLANDVLRSAAPDRVVTAIIAHLAEPNLRDVTGVVVPLAATSLVDPLRVAAEEAPLALTQAVGARLPKASPDVRKRLLSALALAPLGNADRRIVGLITPAMQSEDAFESMLAAVAILRLTDKPGPVAVPVNANPRKHAVELLEIQLKAEKARGILESLGPAASPLLGAILGRVNEVKSDPLYEGYLAQHAYLIAAMGPRAERAAATLLELAAIFAKRKREYELAVVIRALGAIDTTATELIPIVLGHSTSRQLFAAGTSALLSVRAKLNPEQLASLKTSAKEHCTIPKHPRAFDGSWDVCFEALGRLEKIEQIATTDARAPTESKP